MRVLLRLSCPLRVCRTRAADGVKLSKQLYLGLGAVAPRMQHFKRAHCSVLQGFCRSYIVAHIGTGHWRAYTRPPLSPRSTCSWGRTVGIDEDAGTLSGRIRPVKASSMRVAFSRGPRTVSDGCAGSPTGSTVSQFCCQTAPATNDARFGRTVERADLYWATVPRSCCGQRVAVGARLSINPDEREVYHDSITHEVPARRSRSRLGEHRPPHDSAPGARDAAQRLLLLCEYLFGGRNRQQLMLPKLRQSLLL